MGLLVLFEEEIGYHKILFSGASLGLGRVHWCILKAHNEMYHMMYRIEEDNSEKEDDDSAIKPVKMDVTPFGEEVGQDEIHWWVFKKEDNIDELCEKTRNLLESAQKLKEDSITLETKFVPRSYKELVYVIKEFTDQHAKEIQALHDYVFWLSDKDVLAPKKLFTYRVWGSTRLSDRIIETAEAIEKDEETVRKCTELALGLRSCNGYSISGIYWDIASDIADGYDPEERPLTITVPEDTLLTRTSRDALRRFAIYFEFIRQSLRNVIIDTEQCKTEARLLYNESFWERFVTKAMGGRRVETQLWDFKKTLEMWHCTPDRKIDFEIDFAEQVGSYANTNGGVLIIGITDEFPRRVVGVQDLENKIKSAKAALARFIDSSYSIHFQQIVLKDDTGRDCDCLIVAIAKASHVVAVKDQQGKFSYPVRQGTGRSRSSFEAISISKRAVGIQHDNYNFLSSLAAFVSGK